MRQHKNSMQKTIRNRQANTERARRSPSGQKGFTLLLAALVAAIVLSIGTSIFAIAAKEVTLSAAGRDSQFAFYAADTAAECALYWDARTDIHPNTFATSSNSRNNAQSIMCNGQAVAVALDTNNPPTATAATTTFSVTLFAGGSASGNCAQVAVAKVFNQTSNSERTTIDSNGYSVPCTIIATAQTAVQRSVELNY
jgi:Tfp pilus assembly protein PilX